jgi:predicted enzyme related to lactoylglutathione lyase
MGKRERYERGAFCWVDLATTDPAGAKAFYGELFGWEAEDMPAGEAGTYTMLRLGGDEVCALYEMDAARSEQGIPPYWFSYVSVESADAAASRARELGGAVYGEAFDVLDSGRMALIGDPTGAAVGVWQPLAHIGADRANDPGCFTWNELQSRDPETVAAFYATLFALGDGAPERRREAGLRVDQERRAHQRRYHADSGAARRRALLLARLLHCPLV